MCRPKIGQVIIPCMQLTSLSSAGRGAANEMVKRKYLTLTQSPFPFLNGMLRLEMIRPTDAYVLRSACQRLVASFVLQSPPLSPVQSPRPGNIQFPFYSRDRNPTDGRENAHVLAPVRLGPFSPEKRGGEGLLVPPEEPLLSEECQPGCCRLHDAVSPQSGLSTQIQPFRGSLLLPWHLNFWLPPLPSSELAVILESLSGAIRGQSSLTAPAS